MVRLSKIFVLVLLTERSTSKSECWISFGTFWGSFHRRHVSLPGASPTVSGKVHIDLDPPPVAETGSVRELAATLQSALWCECAFA